MKEFLYKFIWIRFPEFDIQHMGLIYLIILWEGTQKFLRYLARPYRYDFFFFCSLLLYKSKKKSSLPSTKSFTPPACHKNTFFLFTFIYFQNYYSQPIIKPVKKTSVWPTTYIPKPTWLFSSFFIIFWHNPQFLTIGNRNTFTPMYLCVYIYIVT